MLLFNIVRLCRYLATNLYENWLNATETSFIFMQRCFRNSISIVCFWIVYLHWLHMHTHERTRIRSMRWRISFVIALVWHYWRYYWFSHENDMVPVSTWCCLLLFREQMTNQIQGNKVHTRMTTTTIHTLIVHYETKNEKRIQSIEL